MARIIEKAGTSPEDAVILLNIRNSEEGIQSEHDFLRQKFGRSGTDFKITGKELIFDHNQTPYHCFLIHLTQSRQEIRIYFDIRSFYSETHLDDFRIPSLPGDLQPLLFCQTYEILYNVSQSPLGFSHWESDMMLELCFDTEVN